MQRIRHVANLNHRCHAMYIKTCERHVKRIARRRDAARPDACDRARRRRADAGAVRGTAQFTCVHTQTGTGQGGSAAGAAATACENATGVNATAVGTGSIANGITDQSLDSPKFGLAERPTHPPLHRRQLRLDVCGGLLPSPLWGAVDAIR